MSGVMLWKWNHLNDTWEKVPAVVSPKRMAAAGQVIAGAHKLYWITCTPSAGNSVWELTDDLDGLGAVVLDCFSTSREGKGFSLTPPMPFDTGIYLKTFTNMTSVTFGYV